MNSSCTKCEQYLQNVKLNKKISVDQAQVINELNIKNKNDQELVKKLLTEVDKLNKSNNELNIRLKVEIDKNEKQKLLERKYNELESELQNIIQNNNNQVNSCSTTRKNVMNIDKVLEDGNILKDLKFKLQKYEVNNEELLKNIAIKDDYIKTLDNEVQNNNAILIENKKLILLNEELKCTLDNIIKECKTCQELKEQKQELKKSNMKYQMEIKAFKRKSSDLDRELKEVNIFNAKIQNENIKLMTQIDKYKELQPGKVEELSRTIERLKHLISSDTKQRKMEINKTCEICKVTANLIFDCFKGNESYRAVNSMSQKLLEAYKHAKFTLLKHVQNNLITHMLTIEGESDLLKSIEEIIERDKSQKISGKKIKPNETDDEISSPSFMTADSEEDIKINDFSGDNTDHEMHNRIGDRKNRNVLSKTSKNPLKDVNSNTKETIEIIALEEIFPEDSLKYRQETSGNKKNSAEVQKIGIFSKEICELSDEPSCQTFYYDSSINGHDQMNLDKGGFVELNSENNNYKQGEGLESLISYDGEHRHLFGNALKTHESINNIDEFPESCKGAEYISTPFCIDNDIEIIGTYTRQSCAPPCNLIKLIKTENSNENQNFSTVSPMQSNIMDCEVLNLSINDNPLNLSLKPDPFETKPEVAEFDCIIDLPLNLSAKNSNKFHQSKHFESKFLHSTPIFKFSDHYMDNSREQVNRKRSSSLSTDFQTIFTKINNSADISSILVSKQVNSEIKEIAKHDLPTIMKGAEIKSLIEPNKSTTINNNRKLSEIIGKSVEKRKITDDINPEMCSKRLRLENGDSGKDQYSTGKHREIDFSNLQRVANEINGKDISRYHEMVAFTSRNYILPTLSLPINIDYFDQSKTIKTSNSNHPLRKSNELITEDVNPLEKPTESAISINFSSPMEKSQKIVAQLENVSISLDNQESTNIGINEASIENIFRELISQQNPKDFLSIIRHRIVMETESHAKRFVDSLLEFFLLDKYKSFDRKLTADIAYYLMLCLCSQWRQPIYDYWSIGLLAAFRSHGLNPVLLMANLALLVFLQRSDQLIGFLVDLIRLPNVRLLSVIRWISRPADLFPARLAANHPSVIDLIKRIVVLEYSVTTGDNKEPRKSFRNIPLDSQRFWLDGDTTETLSLNDDAAPIVLLANQIAQQYKSQNCNLRLDNLDKDIELKYVIK